MMLKKKNETFASRDLPVYLKKEDAVGAQKCSLNNCVLARAVRGHFESIGITNFDRLEVNRSKTIIYRNDGSGVVYRTPPNLRENLKKFDKTGVWDGPTDTIVTFKAVTANRRTPEQKEQTRLQDAIRKPLAGRKQPELPPRTLTI